MLGGCTSGGLGEGPEAKGGVWEEGFVGFVTWHARGFGGGLARRIMAHNQLTPAEGD